MHSDVDPCEFGVNPEASGLVEEYLANTRRAEAMSPQAFCEKTDLELTEWTRSGTDDVRGSMARLGAPGSRIQKILTILTGQPLSPLDAPTGSATGTIVSSAASLLVGVIASAMIWHIGGVAMLATPIAWVATLHGLRKTRAVVMHQAAHRNLFRSPRLDRSIGKGASILLWSEEFDGYARAHVQDHHGQKHQRLGDPTVDFLFAELGVRAGMDSASMWRRLALTLASPVYHGRFAYSRIRSHYAGTPLWHRLVATAHLAGLACLMATPAGGAIVFAWLIPVFPLMQIVSALRLSSEHVFPPAFPPRRGKETLGLYTTAIFVGEAAPAARLHGLRGTLAWTGWWLRLVVWHLPLRLVILPGDGVVHDLHHQYPQLRDWPDHIAKRASAAAAGDPSRAPYRDIWGVFRAIDACFASLAKADPQDFPFDAARRRQLINQ